MFLFLYFPINIYAYSSKIAIGGNTIGIEVKSDGVYVVGFYEVNNKLIAKMAGFKVGDIIKEVDNNKLTNIESLNNIIKDNTKYKFKVLRNNKYIDIDLDVLEDDNVLKTGLYVKDTINGVGTLSYVDPETKVYGSLGHEILESTTLEKFNIISGNIFKAEVSYIKKSSDGVTGEKNANVYKDIINGDISLNESTGIYGIYSSDISELEILDIADKSEIKSGSAYIRTSISKDIVNEYEINIISLDEEDNTKNILFEIVDKELLNKTGGIIQGMSGSPIIQNNKIIGVVNYVIVDDVTKGYGIFIKTMLKEGDKIIS
jgi:stage IV sporulation protein B